LNALGYLTKSDWCGNGPALRDGEVVIPAYDMDVYQEFIKLMNQFYTDGIIDPTFFTIEPTEVNGQVNEGKTAVYNDAIQVVGMSNYEEWESAFPLTSDWQTEPEIYEPNYVTTGCFMISADTEYPELCLRFAELFYNDETDASHALRVGYGYDSGWDFGYAQCTFRDGVVNYYEDKMPEGMGGWDYQVEYLIGNVWSFGSNTTRPAVAKLAKENGCEDWPTEELPNYTGENLFRNSILTNMKPYATPTDHYFWLFYEWFADDLLNATHDQIINRWLKGYYAARNEGEKIGFTVLPGAEVQFDNTINHYLIYGVDEEFFYQAPLLNQLKNLEELNKLLPEYVCVVQAHPFRVHATICDPSLLFGIEIYNGGTEPFRNDMAEIYAKHYGKRMTSGSDCHSLPAVGKGGIITNRKILTPYDLTDVLRNGTYSVIKEGQNDSIM